MTTDECKILEYMVARGGAVSWARLREQFGLSEGALSVPINTLKRSLCVEQDGLFYRVTAGGKAALDRFTNPTKREPFESIPEW